MARPVVHDSALRDRLLEVTAELVDRDGPARLALRDVARQAGTSTTAVYSLFGGKAELVSAVLDAGFASFAASQRAASDGGLRALGAAYREWAVAHPALYRLMFGGALALSEGCSPTPEIADSAIAPLHAAVAEGQREGRVRPGPVPEIALVIWAQVHGLVSLELSQMAPPGLDWAAGFEAALDAVGRAWAAAPGSSGR